MTDTKTQYRVSTQDESLHAGTYDTEAEALERFAELLNDEAEALELFAELLNDYPYVTPITWCVIEVQIITRVLYAGQTGRE